MIFTLLGDLDITTWDFDTEDLLEFDKWIEPYEYEDNEMCELLDDWDLCLECLFASLAIEERRAIELAELLLKHTDGEPLYEIRYRLELATRRAA